MCRILVFSKAKLLDDIRSTRFIDEKCQQVWLPNIHIYVYKYYITYTYTMYIRFSSPSFLVTERRSSSVRNSSLPLNIIRWHRFVLHNATHKLLFMQRNNTSGQLINEILKSIAYVIADRTELNEEPARWYCLGTTVTFRHGANSSGFVFRDLELFSKQCYF